MFLATVFSISALAAASLGTLSTSALWNDTASVDGSYSFSQVWVEAQAESLSPDILKPANGLADPQHLWQTWDPDSQTYSRGPASNCSTDYTCGSWIYDTVAAQNAIIAMVKSDPSKPSYSIASVARLSAKSYGSLSWDVGYWFNSSQTGSSSDKDDMWQQSVKASGIVSDPSQCLPDPSWTGTPAHNSVGGGPSFSPGIAVDGASMDHYVCIVQTYVPIQYSNTVTASNENFTHTDSWNGIFYATKKYSPLPTTDPPTLTLGISVKDPLNG